jgi:hypothetical protein
MKLTFWRIPGLVTHRGFAITDMREKPGTLSVRLEHLEHQGLTLLITFLHTGFMVTHEFGMERYIAESPAKRGEGGSNFFTCVDSEFERLCRRGSYEESESPASYLLIDPDHWLEVLTMHKPTVELNGTP